MIFLRTKIRTSFICKAADEDELSETVSRAEIPAENIWKTRKKRRKYMGPRKKEE